MVRFTCAKHGDSGTTPLWPPPHSTQEPGTHAEHDERWGLQLVTGTDQALDRAWLGLGVEVQCIRDSLKLGKMAMKEMWGS
jgi:hypothetical protein